MFNAALFRLLALRGVCVLLLSSLASLAQAYCFTAYQGQLSFSASGSTNSPAGTVCQQLIDAGGRPRTGSYGALGGANSPGGRCYYYPSGGGIDYFGDWVRSGTPETMCEAPPPVDCSDTAGNVITRAQVCQYVAALKTYVCDDQIQEGGCLYTGAANKKCFADLTTGQGICTTDFYGSGQPAGEGVEECTEESCTPPRDPEVPPAEEQCITNGNVTVCHNPQKPGCGSVNGVEGCFQEDPGCGYFNGVYDCYGTDKPQNNCGYFNGKYTCSDPNDPTKIIPETSPDHPKNGGNADGNENNDPTAPGQTGNGSPQGSDQGATNEAIGKLGDELGGKLDETNGLLSAIKGVLDGIADGIEELLGGEYDGSGDGENGAIAGEASGQGSELGDQISDFTEQMITEREAEAESDLTDKIPDLVSGENGMFDPDGVAFQTLDFLNDVLPSHLGCSDYTITFRLDKYTVDFILPVCELSRVKPLLEYVIWLITVIGLWKILYSGLRLEDAKASKGGY